MEPPHNLRCFKTAFEVSDDGLDEGNSGDDASREAMDGGKVGPRVKVFDIVGDLL
jgi:hypothetical protein